MADTYGDMSPGDFNDFLQNAAPDSANQIKQAMAQAGIPQANVTAEVASVGSGQTVFLSLDPATTVVIVNGQSGPTISVASFSALAEPEIPAYGLMMVSTLQDTVISLNGASYTALWVAGESSSTVLAGNGSYLTVTGNGDDLIYGGTGEFQLLQGLDHDTLVGGGTNVLLAFGEGGTLYGGLTNTAADTLVAGTDSTHTMLKTYLGNNSLFGVSGGDTLMGGAGADTLTAGLVAGAHDTLIAGAGNNLLQVVQGNNSLYSSGGSDILIGGSGHDTLYGGGHSVLIAGSGGTTLQGVAGDSLLAGTGNDVLSVRAGAGTFWTGQGGNDSIFGGTGNDYFYNELAGHDTIYGGGGNDTLFFWNYTQAEVTMTVNSDGSTLYSFGAGEDTKTALVYNVQNITFKQPV